MCVYYHFRMRKSCQVLPFLGQTTEHSHNERAVPVAAECVGPTSEGMQHVSQAKCKARLTKGYTYTVCLFYLTPC